MSQLDSKQKFGILMTVIISLAVAGTVLGGIYLSNRNQPTIKYLER